MLVYLRVIHLLLVVEKPMGTTPHYMVSSDPQCGMGLCQVTLMQHSWAYLASPLWILVRGV